MSCGIYKIENNINHKVYIGQSTNIELRWRHHRSPNSSIRLIYPLYRAIDKYGIENFSFDIIEECKKEELDEREIYWINFYNSFNEGYNQTSGGQGAKDKGRVLKLEQVREIRKELQFSNKTEKEIAKEYSVSENIVVGINTGYYWKDSNISYPIRKQIKKLFFCQNCGVELKTYNASLCINCFREKQKKVKERPSAGELTQILYENNGNFSLVGKMFNVSDNTIRKWCKNYNIPSHSSDYKEPKEELEKKSQKSLPIPVQQIDRETGEIINQFLSLKEAEQKTGILHIRQASDPKNNQRQTAGGYIWKRI